MTIIPRSNQIWHRPQAYPFLLNPRKSRAAVQLLTEVRASLIDVGRLAWDDGYRCDQSLILHKTYDRKLRAVLANQHQRTLELLPCFRILEQKVSDLPSRIDAQRAEHSNPRSICANLFKLDGDGAGARI